MRHPDGYYQPTKTSNARIKASITPNVTLGQIEAGLDKLASIIAYLSTADMKDDDRDESLSICDRLHDGLCLDIDETI
jgi:hypothetical protein